VPDRGLGRPIVIGDWTYRAVKSAQPRDGVPWKLIVTPAAESTAGWRKGLGGLQILGLAGVGRKVVTVRRPGGDEGADDPESVPVVIVPDILWKQWMAAGLQDVVGIHFHEFVTDDVARILYTVHKVPPDGSDGTPPGPGGRHGRAGTRLEGTLLAPVTFNLDQTIAARQDPLDKGLVDRRAQHEAGHAQVSQEVFMAVLRGPQDWDPQRCTGRRSRLEYYWKRERIGRSWDGYRNGVGKMLTLRTSIALVPPTRWSILLPIPPERLTQKHIQAFNDAIVLLGPWFGEVDHRAQQSYHARHGSFE
jgi:hypothetical protein